MDHIIKHYQSNQPGMMDLINCIITHTDNCPAQCKCRQNFAQLLKKTTTHKIAFLHKFSQKHGFKGLWDGTSKLIKNQMSKL